MLGLPILDVAIGIAFFYLLFSMICTTVNESLARWFNKRPKTLEEAITNLLGDEKIKNKLLSHPLIAGLSRTSPGKKSATPSYIPASIFASALLDDITGEKSMRDREALEAGIAALPEPAKKSLTALYEKAGKDFDRFHQQVEVLYNAAMDRASGWYKRYVQKQTKVLALIIVLWTDFDTLHVAERLWTDSTLRAAVVEEAKERAKARNSGDIPLATYPSDQPDQGKAVDPGTNPVTEKEQSIINSVTGWERDMNELHSRIEQAEKEPDQAKRESGIFHIKLKWFLMHLLGWLLSMFAISLGAPFWFDVLNRFMNLRNSGRSPDEKRTKNDGEQMKGAIA